MNTLKICWDNLEHIVLMPSLGNSIVPRWIYYEYPEYCGNNKGEFIEAEKPCLECNEPFLKRKNYKPVFCSDECKNKNRSAPNNTPKVDERLKENGGGRHLVGNTNGGWNKGLGLPKDSCNFDTFDGRINWFTETRKDPDDERVLQTKCCICGKWYRPSEYRVRLVLNYVNGKSDKSSWGFYCSKECENKCPHFGKPIEYIMKQDYMNSGRAKYSELHGVPDKILYYDWQEDLKKLQKPLVEKTNKREKKKLRRRKKRDSELRRMENKRKRKKEKEAHLKTNAYQKEYHLKKILYLSRQRAKLKGWAHDLDYDWLIVNTPERCPKCDIEFRYDKNIKMDPWAPSIDRIDLEKGYTKDNCMVVSWMFNCGKNSYDEKTLYIICRAILKQFDHDTP